MASSVFTWWIVAFLCSASSLKHICSTCSNTVCVKLLLCLFLQELCSTVGVSEKQLGLLDEDIIALEKQLAKKHRPPSPLIQRRNCQRGKGTPARAVVRPLPTPKVTPEVTPDLICLDDDKRTSKDKDHALPVHDVPLLNPHVTEQAPVIVKSKMAANFDNLGKSDSNLANVSASVSPQRVIQESRLKGKHKQEEDDRKTKRQDSFSFVDDLLAEHKTISSSKQQRKAVKPSSSIEKSARHEKVEQSNATHDLNQGSKSVDVPGHAMAFSMKHGDGPSTTFQSDDTMEFEVSSSPTF